jgi:hypothetical protein
LDFLANSLEVRRDSRRSGGIVAAWTPQHCSRDVQLDGGAIQPVELRDGIGGRT